MPNILSASLAAFLNGLLSAAGNAGNILNNTAPVYVSNPIGRIVFYSDPSMSNEIGSAEDDPSRPAQKDAYDACANNGVTGGSFAAEGYNGGGGGGGYDNPQN